MGTRDDRIWGRIQHGLLKGMALGGAGGAALGLILGAIVFHGVGAILSAMLAGAIGLGGLGAFWGVLAGLESPQPGHEPSDVERPLDVPGLTTEDRGPRRVF